MMKLYLTNLERQNVLMTQFQLADHWWRMIDYSDVIRKIGVVINPEKFQLVQN